MDGTTIQKYNITVNDSEGGTVTASTSSATSGSAITITASPYSGYRLSSIVVKNGQNVDVSLTDQGDNKYTFRMPSSNVTITATFELIDTAH